MNRKIVWLSFLALVFMYFRTRGEMRMNPEMWKQADYTNRWISFLGNFFGSFLLSVVVLAGITLLLNSLGVMRTEIAYVLLYLMGVFMADRHLKWRDKSMI